MTPWKDLTLERQLALREAYSEAMANQPTTCSLDEKVARFAAWLQAAGVAFSAEDLPKRGG